MANWSPLAVRTGVAQHNAHRRFQMTRPDHATAVASLLEASATLPGEARLRFLQRACGGDSALLEEVESLLDALEAGSVPAEASSVQTGLVSRDHVHQRLRVPDVLAGRYRIRSQLGVGGMAVVYLADDETLHRSVAVKIQRPDIIRRGGRERFDDEIRLTANLRHPGIVPLFDCGEADGFSFFVMPHIAGETLRDHLARVGAMTLEDAVRVANDVLAALQYAHNAGIVHRDVKPSNIMLESGRAMLADFGIAHAMEADAAALSSAGSGAGTPAYMSPEQTARSIQIGRASDIYSTGCTVYEMLTGTRPTRAVSRMALASTAFDSWAKERATLTAVAPAVCDVIERAVALDPTHRFASAAEFGRALTVVSVARSFAQESNAVLASAIRDAARVGRVPVSISCNVQPVL